MKRVVSIIMPLIGLAIFVWIVRGTGVDRILATFRNVDPAHLAVFPLFIVFLIFMKGLRWQYLMRRAGIRYSLWRSCVVWTIGFFAGSITPGKVGDALRAYYVSRDTDHNLGETFLTVFVDRLMDLVTILLGGIVAMLAFSYYYTEIASVWIAVAAVVLIIAGLYLVTRRELVRALFRPISRALIPAKYQDEMAGQFHSFYDSMARYGAAKVHLLVAYGLTLVGWVGVVAMGYTVARVLSLDVSFGYVLLMMPALTIVEVLPISISGLGTREAAVIFFFSAIGIDRAHAVSFSLLYLIIGTYCTAVVGFVAWTLRPRLLRDTGGNELAGAGEERDS